jgi:DNA-binding NarL/FixJ family response regulator
MIRAFITDDNLGIRKYLKRCLGYESDICVVGEAASGEKTLETIHDTDVLITDLNMKGMNGIQITEQIKKILPELRVIIWSSSTEKVYISKAMESGAKAYVDKTSGVDTLLEAIRSVVREDFDSVRTS